LSDLIDANHILDYHEVVNGFGHISLRNPDDPTTFYMTGVLPPALMRSVNDLALFTVGDAVPVSGSTGNAASNYHERFIHASILAAYPGVNSVIHSHALPLVARGNTADPLRPMINLAAFLGNGVPVYDPEDFYPPGAQRLLLVNSEYLGDALAATFSGNGTSVANGTANVPPISVVLQRAHGFTCWGTTVHQAVFKAIYTLYNEQIQETAEVIVASEGGPDPEFLSPSEIVDSQPLSEGGEGKEWPLWKAQVDASPLYHNNL
ncbi:uncharacterized protein K452DRAFT_197411, partial [Aplosporella prunicola CBS 121167]